MDLLLDTVFSNNTCGSGGAARPALRSLEAGPWQQFLTGPEAAGHGRHLGALWKRLVGECGAATALADRHRIDWEALARDEQVPLVLRTDAAEAVDVAAEVCRTQHDAWAREARYARIHRPLAADLSGLVAADTGALRSGLLDDGAFRDHAGVGQAELQRRWMRALTGTAAYLAALHFIPAALALDVVTTAPLDAESRQALRLPAPWSLIVHEPVAVAAAQADDDELAAHIDAGRCAGRQPAILGGLLAARPDFTVDATTGFLLVAGADAAGRRSWFLQHAAYGDHPAGRVLYAYAAQLAFARWADPPTLPDQDRAPASRSALARVARSPAGRNGGWHQVRVLDYTPPPNEPATERPSAAGPGNPRE